MNNCLFCDIVNNQVDSYKVYEDNEVLAFLDINPHNENPGHTLIIPKKHQQNFLEGNYDFDFLKKIQHVANILKEKLKCDGIKIVNNNGASAGQIIFHTHFHIIPYYDSKPTIQASDLEEVIRIINN